MRQLKNLSITLAIWGGLTLLLVTQLAKAQVWLPIRGGINFGISGMALLQHQENSLTFLVVHDNKKAEEVRLATVTINNQPQPQYSPWKWSTNEELPIDLESLTTVPGQQELTFIALASSGKAYHFKVNTATKQVSLLKIFDLPATNKNSNFEGFSVQAIDGNLLAVWGHRGADQDPGVIYWGLLDLNRYEITQQGSHQLRVPWPVSSVRHISDLRVDQAGVLYISAATDPGDDGPFTSAVYIAGVFSVEGKQIAFRQNPNLVTLYHLENHKVEAIELVPGAGGGIFLGTDDENRGSSIFIRKDAFHLNLT